MSLLRIKELEAQLARRDERIAELEREAGKEETLVSIMRQFIQDQSIYCPETIHQSDRVIMNAFDLIERLCDVAGYMIDDED